MQSFMDIYEISKKISSPLYLISAELSRLKTAQRIIWILLMLYILSSVWCIWVVPLINNTHSILLFGLFLMYFITMIFAISKKEKLRRIAFKPFYDSHKRELRYLSTGGSFLRYLLLTEKLIKKNLYTTELIKMSLKRLNVESKNLKPDSIFNHPVITITLSFTGGIVFKIYESINHGIIPMSLLLLSAIVLGIFLFLQILIKLNENIKKGRHLELKQNLQRMILDLERNNILNIEQSCSTVRPNATAALLINHGLVK